MSNRASTKNVFMVNCHASIKGLFAGMVVFSTTLISVILYAVFRNKIGDDIHGVSSFSLHSNASHQNKLHSRAAVITSTLTHKHKLVLPTPPSVHNPFQSISETPRTILYSIAIVEIVNLSLLVISLSATIWALMKIRKLQYKRTTTRTKRKVVNEIFD